MVQFGVVGGADSAAASNSLPQIYCVFFVSGCSLMTFAQRVRQA